jgi:hypothetical protein
MTLISWIYSCSAAEMTLDFTLHLDNFILFYLVR